MSFLKQNKHVHPTTHKPPRLAVFAWGLLLIPLWASALPNETDTASDSVPATMSLDSETDVGQASDTTDSTSPTTEPAAVQHTIAAQYTPKIDALIEQNKTLLEHNIALQQRIDSLQTQVDVLIYERQGQLFLYGAATVLISMLIGAGLARLFWRQSSRW